MLEPGFSLAHPTLALLFAALRAGLTLVWAKGGLDLPQ